MAYKTNNLGLSASLEPLTELLEQRLYLDGTPQLPGLHLIDPNPDNIRGLIYIDIDGEDDVTYNGPVTIENIEVPAFAAPGNLAGLEQEIILQVLGQLEGIFSGTSITFTIEQPSEEVAYSTVFVGGRGHQFASYGDIIGISEQIDAGNQCLDDNAFLFTGVFAPGYSTTSDFADEVADGIAHETGHLIGFAHDEAGPDENAMTMLAKEFKSPDGSSQTHYVTAEEDESHEFIVDGILGSSEACVFEWYRSEYGSENFLGSGSSWSGNLYTDPTMSQTFSSPGTYWMRCEIWDRTWTGGYGEWREAHRWKITVTEKPNLDVDKNSLDFDYNDSSKTFYVQNDGGGTLEYSITDNVSWLSYSTTSGSTTGSSKITVYLDRDKMDWGNNQSATITIKNKNNSSDKETISVKADNPDPDPKASRSYPTDDSITLDYGASQKFTVKGTDDGGDLDKVVWTLTGADSDSDTDSNFFGGSSDTSDFKDASNYKFNKAGDYTLTARVYDESGDYDDATWSIHVNDPPRPDLDVVSIELDDDSSVWRTGDSIDAKVTVKNIGHADADDCKVHYYLGTSSDKTYREICSGNLASVNGMQPDESESDWIGSFIIGGGWTIPSDVPDGTYYIWVNVTTSSDDSNSDNDWDKSRSFEIEEPNYDPGEPGELTDSNVTRHSATVSWEAAIDPNVNDSITYKVEYGKTNSILSIFDWSDFDGWTMATPDGGISDTFVDIDGLEADKAYSVRITALDGRGGVSRRVYSSAFTTSPNHLPTQPDDIATVSVGFESATIEWDASEDEDGDQLTYYIQYGKNSVWDGWNPSEPLSTTDHKITIYGLEPGTVYDVRVWASDSFGDSGTEKKNKAFKTDSAPGRVSDLEASVDDKKVSLNWVLPDYSGCKGVILVRYESDAPDKNLSGSLPSVGDDIYGGTVLLVSSGSVASYIDTEVNNGKPYYYAIWAYDDAGNYSDSPASVLAVPRYEPTISGDELYEFISRGIVYAEGSMVGGDVKWSKWDDVELKGNSYATGYVVDEVFDFDQTSGFYALGLNSINSEESILAFRGTQDRIDGIADLDKDSIGYHQLDTAWNSIKSWLKDQDLVSLVGHSLGGALAQLAGAWLTESVGTSHIQNIVTFNSPGINDDEAEKFDSSRISGSVTHYISSGDIVSLAGEAFIEGEYILYDYDCSFNGSVLDLIMQKHGRPMLLGSYVDADGELRKSDSVVEIERGSTSTLNSAGFSYLAPSRFDGDYFNMVLSVGSQFPGQLLASQMVCRGNVESIRQSFAEFLLIAEDLIVNGVQSELVDLGMGSIDNSYNIIDNWGRRVDDTLYILKDFTSDTITSVVEKVKHNVEENVARTTVTVDKHVGWIEMVLPDVLSPKTLVKAVTTSSGRVIPTENWYVKEGNLHILDDPVTEYIIEYDVGATEGNTTASVSFSQVVYCIGDSIELIVTDLDRSLNSGGGNDDVVVQVSSSIDKYPETLVLHETEMEGVFMGSLALSETEVEADGFIMHIAGLEAAIALQFVDPSNSNGEIQTIEATATILGGTVAMPSEFYVDEDSVFNGVLQGVDAQGDLLAFSVFSQPEHAKLFMVNEDGSFTYVPEDNWNGQDSFTFKVTDGDNTSESAVVDLIVNPINDGPEIFSQSFPVIYEQEFVGQVIAADVDSEEIVFSISVNAEHGVLSIEDNGKFTYTPDQKFVGEDSFFVAVTDGEYSAQAKMTLLVGEIAGLPQSMVTDEDTSVQGQLEGIDAQDDSLIFAKHSDCLHGNVDIASSGSFIYTPEYNWSGADTFAFTVTDGVHVSQPVTVNITVKAVNDKPVVVDGVIGVQPLSGSQTFSLSDLVSDIETDGVDMIYELDYSELDGTLSLLDSGQFVYDSGQFVGITSFKFRVTDTGQADSHELVSDWATVIMEVGIRKDLDDKGKLVFQDADKNTVQLSLKGPGTGYAIFAGDDDAGIIKLVLDNTTSKSAFLIKSSDSGHSTTIGEIEINGSLGKLVAKSTDIVGGGIYVAEDGYIKNISIGDLKNGADIVVPGNGPAGVVIQADVAGLGSEIILGAYLKSFKATEFAGDMLMAPWAKTISIKGDCNTDIILSEAAANGCSLVALKVSGTIIDTNISLSGFAGTITAAKWAGGEFNAEWAKAIKIKGGAGGGISGDMGVTVDLHGFSSDGISLYSLKATGIITGSTIRTAGSINSIIAGATNDTDFMAGLENEVTGHAFGHDDFLNSLAAIKTFKVKGIAGQSARFFVDTNISAAQIGKVKILNGDLSSESGLYSYASDGKPAIKQVINKDLELGSKWVWPTKNSAPSDEYGFIHIL